MIFYGFIVFMFCVILSVQVLLGLLLWVGFGLNLEVTGFDVYVDKVLVGFWI